MHALQVSTDTIDDAKNFRHKIPGKARPNQKRKEKTFDDNRSMTKKHEERNHVMSQAPPVLTIHQPTVPVPSSTHVQPGSRSFLYQQH